MRSLSRAPAGARVKPSKHDIEAEGHEPLPSRDVPPITVSLDDLYAAAAGRHMPHYFVDRAYIPVAGCGCWNVARGHDLGCKKR